MLRFFDIVLSAIGLLISLPILALISLMGFFDTGSPFFFQQRVGRHRQPFTLVKFRTMRRDTLSVASHLADASAITRLGRLLRKTKFDELPQLWNVLKGEMSLIGPRPLLVSYRELYTKQQMKRHDVKPGITGWAQINGRNSLTWKKKFELDVYYVEHQNFKLDFIILIKTIKKILIPSHVNQSKEYTAPMFNGKN